MRLTLVRAARQFLADLSAAKSPNTITNYRRYLAHFSDYLSDIFLTDLSLQKLIQYRAFLLHQSQLSPTTQNYHLIAVRQFIKYLHSSGLSQLTAADLKLLPVSPRHAIVTPTPVPQNITSSDNLRDQLIFNLIVTTGLKVSEIVQLDRSDILPNMRQITAGSTNKRRTLLLDPATAVLLEKYLTTRRDTLPALFIRQKNRSSSSNRLTPRTIQRVIRQSSPDSSLTPSKLRHQYANELFSEGVSTTQAGNLLGHTNKSTTIRYRSQLTASH